VPFAPAGLNVWHEEQPFAANTAFPAVALPPPPEEVVVEVDDVVGFEVVVGVEVEPIVTV
jgi:hypothetical protein